MLRLYRRVRYGDTSTPKYITKQHRWLYKNRWVGLEEVCKHYKVPLLKYSYEYEEDGRKHLECVHTIDEYIAAIIKHKNIHMVNITDFSGQEVELIIQVQKLYFNKELNRYLEKLNDFNETLNKFRF